MLVKGKEVGAEGKRTEVWVYAWVGMSDDGWGTVGLSAADGARGEVAGEAGGLQGHGKIGQDSAGRREQWRRAEGAGWSNNCVGR